MPNLLATDEVPQYIPLGTFTMALANAIEAFQIAKELIEPTIKLNAKGQISGNKMQVWDCQELWMETDGDENDPEGVSGQLSYDYVMFQDNSRVFDKTDFENSLIDIDDDKLVMSLLKTEKQQQQSAAGDVWASGRTNDRVYVRTFPQTMVDGNMYGKLLTANHYGIQMDTGGVVGVRTIKVGMIARRVEVDIPEVLFDQRDAADIVVASQILFG